MTIPGFSRKPRQVQVLALNLLLGMALLSACQSIPDTRPLPPEVRIESVKLARVGLDRQDLAIALYLRNPNNFDLPLQYMQFVATLDGQALAQGLSSEPVRLPANGEADMKVLVSTRLNRLLGQLLTASKKGETHIAYDIRGFVKLSNWPTRIPFAVDGLVDNPVTR